MFSTLIKTIFGNKQNVFDSPESDERVKPTHLCKNGQVILFFSLKFIKLGVWEKNI